MNRLFGGLRDEESGLLQQFSPGRAVPVRNLNPFAETPACWRERDARAIIENDPDRDKVVSTFGEDTTQAIEEAAML